MLRKFSLLSLLAQGSSLRMMAFAAKADLRYVSMPATDAANQVGNFRRPLVTSSAIGHVHTYIVRPNDALEVGHR